MLAVIGLEQVSGLVEDVWQVIAAQFIAEIVQIARQHAATHD